MLHVVEQDRGVRQHHSLGARMGDVALVPQGDVLEARLRVSAKHPGEPGDPLAEDRVALVRHRRRSLLAGAERLLDLAHLGALEVSDLGREALQPRAGDRDSRQDHGVPVARHHLGRGILAREAPAPPSPGAPPRAAPTRRCRRRPTACRRRSARRRPRGGRGCGRPRRRSRRAGARRSWARRGPRGFGRRRACRGAQTRARPAPRGTRAPPRQRSRPPRGAATPAPCRGRRTTSGRNGSSGPPPPPGPRPRRRTRRRRGRWCARAR